MTGRRGGGTRGTETAPRVWVTPGLLAFWWQLLLSPQLPTLCLGCQGPISFTGWREELPSESSPKTHELSSPFCSHSSPTVLGRGRPFLWQHWGHDWLPAMALGKDLLALLDPWTLPGMCSPSYPFIPSCLQQTRRGVCGTGCLNSGALSLPVQWSWEAGPIPPMYWFPRPFLSGVMSPYVCFTVFIIYSYSFSISFS